MTHPLTLNDVSIQSKQADLGSGMPGHPDDVLGNPCLTIEEKRALLASWASDANAVPHLPTLRQLPDGSIVPVVDILRALKSLDAPDDAQPDAWCRLAIPWPRSFKWRRPAACWPFQNRRDSDDDDDPPPCPAIAAGRPTRGGGGALVPPEAVAA